MTLDDLETNESEITAIEWRNEQEHYKGKWKVIELQMVADFIKESDKADLRALCQKFDAFEAGCWGCEHHSEGLDRLGIDGGKRLSCPLSEQQIKLCCFTS